MCSVSPSILVLFVCKSCRSSFSLIEEFIKHKTAKHYDEFKQINCVIFEEQISYGNAVEKGNHGIPTPTLFFEPEAHYYTPTDQTDQDNRLNLTEDSLTDPGPLTYSKKFIKCDEPRQNIQIDALVGNFSDESTATETHDDLNHDSVENFEAIIAGTFDFISGSSKIPEIGTTELPSVKRKCNPSVNLRRLTPSQILKASSFYQNQNNIVIKLEHKDDTSVPVPVSALNLDFNGERDPFFNQQQIKSNILKNSNLNAPPVPLPSTVRLNQEIFDAPTTTTRSDVEPMADLTCKLCFQKFKYKLSLQHHANICSLTQTQTPRSRSRDCVLCNKVFSVPQYLQEHMIRVHGTEEKKNTAYKLKCEVCSKKFLLPRDLLVHMNSHMDVEEGSKPFKCQVCGRSFLIIRYLTRHLGRLHLNTKNTSGSSGSTTNFDFNNVKPDLNCKLCFKKYKSEGELNIHLTICKLCNKDGDCFCVSCNKLLSNAHTFKCHMLTFHGTEEEKKKAYRFKCQCTKKFFRNRELLVHMESHKREDQRSKPFRCKECGRSFFFKEYLKKHFNLAHSHDKVFKCTYRNCKMRFKLKTSLEQHFATHGDPERYHCPHEAICSKNFKYEKELKIHLQNQHD